MTGGLNFTYFDRSIRTLNLTDHNHRIILADHNGTAIVDSLLHINYARKVESVASLQSFKNALEGKSGSIVEPFNRYQDAYFIPSCKGCTKELGHPTNENNITKNHSLEGMTR